MDTPRTSRRAAHAKVNLALAVGPAIRSLAPQAGYHPICSWMACVELADEVSVTRLGAGQGSEYKMEWEADAPRVSMIDWPLEKDLAVRAHRLLEQEAGRALPVEMRVRKRVPVGGGLGGGSADAAAALLGVREVWELPITMARLAELSAKLGSDVAFFLDERAPARAAIVSDLGDRIERVGNVEQAIVLFFPAFGCPTGAVYKAFDAGDAGAGFAERAVAVRRMVASATKKGRIRTDELFNDLAAPACRVEPRLQEMVDRLAGELDVHVHVTGSGSTLFALAATSGDAVRMVARARAALGDVVPVVTRLV